MHKLIKYIVNNLNINSPNPDKPDNTIKPLYTYEFQRQEGKENYISQIVNDSTLNIVLPIEILKEYKGVNKDYWGKYPSGYTNDYWAGANKACRELNMKLPSLAELRDMVQYAKGGGDETGMIPVTDYWWSEEKDDQYAYHLETPHDYNDYYGSKGKKQKLLCIQ